MRAEKAAFIDETCSVACSTNTGELHECVCAPFELDKVAAMLAPKFPAVATMLADAKQDLTAFASFPPAHWAKVWSTNPLERVNKEVKRRTNVVGIFPDDAAVLRLAGAVLIEAHDEWQVAERRYLSEGSMAKLIQTGDDATRPKEVRRATAELVAT